MLKYVLQIQIKVLSRQGTINCNFLGTMWQRHVSYSGYSHNLKIRNLLVFTPSTRTCLESWGRQLQNDIMCDALGFKGSVVGSGKVDNWSFRWNDVTPTGTTIISIRYSMRKMGNRSKTTGAWPVDPHITRKSYSRALQRCAGRWGTGWWCTRHNTFTGNFPQTVPHAASQFKFSKIIQLNLENPPAKNSKLEVTCNPYWRACDKVCALARKSHRA